MGYNQSVNMRRLTTLIIFFLVFFGTSQTKELDSLSVELAFKTVDSLKVDTSLEIIEKLYYSKDYDLALVYIKQSEKLASTINYLKGTAAVTYYKALIYAKKQDYINAKAGYNSAKAIYTKLKDTISLAKIDNSLGLLELQRGNFKEGLKYVLPAIKELERKGLRQELRHAYAGLGEVYFKMHNLNKAIEYNLKALEIQRYLNDSNGVYKTNLMLAELYSKTREHRKAIRFYENVLENHNIKNDSIKLYIFPKIGGEYLEFNDFTSATKYLLKGLKLNRRKNDKQNLLVTLNNLGYLNLKEGRLKTAERQLEEAGLIANAIANNEELLRYYKIMKALDSTRNKFENAFVWQSKYYKLKEKIKTPKIEFSAPAEVVAIEKEDLVLEPEEKTKVAKGVLPLNIFPERQNTGFKQLKIFQVLFYCSAGLLAITLTFLILVYLKRHTRLKYTQELEDKNLKVQLQNEAFEEQTKHLESVNNVKDKLFSIVSHDLKDSLSSINGFIDLLKDGSLSREEFDNLIPELSENANNASLLLFNLLNWSKTQMQSLKPSPSLFDVQEVFDEKIKLIEQRLENKGIAIENRSMRDFAYADRSMFEIIIQNLLANALKFSRQGDTVSISNYISNGNCIVSIADTGVGISKKTMDKLFKKNDAYSTMGTNNEKGTGLGLSICKELVELNNGKIWVESTLGVGSTFFVQLPKSKIMSG